MFSFQYNTIKIDYDLKKSKRKTISISVEPNGIVLVKAPQRLSDAKVLELVKKKSKWITEKLLLVKESETKLSIRQYINGEKFIYLGQEYILQLIDDKSKKKPKVNIFDEKMLITIPTSYEATINENIIKEAIIKWYKQMAKIKLSERVIYFEKLFSEKPGPIIVKEQKRRWGSCSQDGTLRFNWKIIMAPEYIIDYLVVHEMCHLRFMNHSKDFWNLVDKIQPDYKIRKEWLKKNGIMLDL